MWVEAEFDTGPLRGYGFPPVNCQQPGKSSPKVSEERAEIKPGRGGAAREGNVPSSGGSLPRGHLWQ